MNNTRNIEIPLKEEKQSFIRRISLNFIDPKFECEYRERIKDSRVKLNKTVTVVCLIILAMSFLAFASLHYFFDRDLKNEKVRIVKMEEENFLTMKYENYNITQENIFNEEYLIYNITYKTARWTDDITPGISLKSSPLIPKWNKKFNKVVSTYEYFFISYYILISIAVLLIITIVAVWCCSCKDSFQTVIFGLNYFHFSFMLHIIAGLFQIHWKISSGDPMFFTLVVQLLSKMFMIFKSKVWWVSVTLICSVTLVAEWIYFQVWGSSRTYLFYLATNSLIHLILVIVAYRNELSRKHRFHLMKNLSFEREYLIKLLNNLNQGFLSYSDGEVKYANNAMNSIIGFCNKSVGFKGFCKKNNNNNNNKSIININNMHVQEDRSFLALNDQPQLPHPLSLTNKHNLDNTIDPVLVIEKILQNLSEVNDSLPEEILKLLNEKTLSLEKLLKILKYRKEFCNFVYIGTYHLNLPSNEKKTFEITLRVHKQTSNYIEIIFSDISFAVQNEREKAILTARSIYLSKIAHEFKNPLSCIMEIATSIKEGVENEENGCTQRHMIKEMSDYAEKLCKLMIQFLKDFTLFTNLKFPCEKNCGNEGSICKTCLTRNCKKCLICQNCEKSNESSFNYRVVIQDYIDNFKALVKYEGKNQILTYTEEKADKIDKCGRVDTNTSIAGLLLNSVSDFIHKIKTNKQIFSSAIYNLIYHSFKNASNKGEVKVKIKQSIKEEGVSTVNNTKTNSKSLLNPVSGLKSARPSNRREKSNLTLITTFEISDDSLPINEQFLAALFTGQKLIFEGNNYESKTEIKPVEVVDFNNPNMYVNINLPIVNDNCVNKGDNISNDFNKYFDLYVAYYLVKKLGSELKIVSDKTGAKYYFSLNCPLDEISRFNYIESPKINYISASCGNVYNMVGNTGNMSLYQIAEMSRFSRMGILTQRGSPMKTESIADMNCSRATIVNDNPMIYHYTSQRDNREGIVLTACENIPEGETESEILISVENVEKRDVRILIIDDEVMIRRTITRQINNLKKSEEFSNFEISTSEASNCFEAIRLLHSSLTDSLHFDLIITDEYMPNMKGSTLIKLLKQLEKEGNFYRMQIVSHTAFDTVEKKAYILDHGADMILSKPVDVDELKKVVLKVLSLN